MKDRAIAKLDLDTIDQLKYYYEGKDPERRHALTFALAVKHGIPMSSIKRVDIDKGFMEYYKRLDK